MTPLLALALAAAPVSAAPASEPPSDAPPPASQPAAAPPAGGAAGDPYEAAQKTLSQYTRPDGSIDYAQVAEKTRGDPNFGRWIFMKSGSGPIERQKVTDPATGKEREETDEEYFKRAAPLSDQRSWEFYGVPDKNGYEDFYNPAGLRRSGGMSFIPESYSPDKDPDLAKLQATTDGGGQGGAGTAAASAAGAAGAGGDAGPGPGDGGAGLQASRGAPDAEAGDEAGIGQDPAGADGEPGHGAAGGAGGQESFEGQDVQNLGFPPEAMDEINRSYDQAGMTGAGGGAAGMSGAGQDGGAGGGAAGGAAGGEGGGRSVYQTATLASAAGSNLDSGSILGALRALFGLKNELASGRSGERTYENSRRAPEAVDEDPSTPQPWRGRAR